MSLVSVCKLILQKKLLSPDKKQRELQTNTCVRASRIFIKIELRELIKSSDQVKMTLTSKETEHNTMQTYL